MKFKKLLVLIALQVLIIKAYGQETTQQRFKKLEWLVGRWTRTDNQPRQSGYETWSKKLKQNLLGKA